MVNAARGTATIAGLLAVLAGCASDSAGPAQSDPTAVVPRDASDPASVSESDPASGSDVDRATDAVEAAPTRTVQSEAQAPPKRTPIGRYVSSRTVAVRAKPNRDADSVGTIARGQPFDVYALIEGPRCRKGIGGKWVELERGGFACLKHASKTTEPLGIVPRLDEGEIVPYVYARPRKKNGTLPPEVPQWKSKRALLAGDPPEKMRPSFGTFAFRSRKYSKKFKSLYYDAARRVMLGEDLRLLRPSDFAGRDLEAEPLSSDVGLGWVISREASVLAQPQEDAPVKAPLAYHQAIEVVGTDGDYVSVRVPGADGGASIQGYVPDAKVARWLPPPLPDGVANDELWVAVEIREQTLTLMRGPTPTFATLISSGRFADPTPTGEFRIELKKALGTMRSLPDADEPYAVEGVPWAAYFQGRYALHGAYWHDRFGRRNSHGCVNLSPRDAKRVFEALTPAMPGGWVTVRTAQDETTTLIAIRKAS